VRVPVAKPEAEDDWLGEPDVLTVVVIQPEVDALGEGVRPAETVRYPELVTVCETEAAAEFEGADVCVTCGEFVEDILSAGDPVPTEEIV
jgi:hypothetical protein